jgi:hypothetical protein
MLNLTSADLVESMRHNLASGFLISMSFVVYDSFMSEAVKNTGMVPMPNREELKIRPGSGHCMLCCGYDDFKQMFEFHNSWSAQWGAGGYCWMPYEFFKPTGKNKFGDNFCLQILTLPISVNGSAPENNVLQKSLQTLKDIAEKQIPEIIQEIEKFNQTLEKQPKTKKRKTFFRPGA